MTEFSSETAGDLMTRLVPTANATDLVEQIISLLAKESYDDIHWLYILDQNKKLLGGVPIAKLLAAKDNQKITDLVQTVKVVVSPEVDQEKVVIEAVKNDVKQVPVVDKDGTFLGVVTADQIIDVLHSEHLEDSLRSSGIRGNGSLIMELINTRLGELIKLRLPWLLVGLTGGLIASLIISRFEDSLKQNVSLAFFISMIAYMSDAIGTQTETIFIRTMTLMKFNFLKYILREFWVGAIIGSVIGMLTGIFGAILSGSPRVGLVVGLSLFLSMASATILACLTPIVLKALKKDPAVGSGPFTTAIQDLVSLTIYFTIASVVLTKF